MSGKAAPSTAATIRSTHSQKATMYDVFFHL